MLYLLPSPDSLDLPEGTKYRFLSSRTDLFKDSAGNGCHVLESDAELDFEKVPEEQLPALGDTTNCIERWVEHKVIDKDAMFQAEMEATAARIYGTENFKTLSMRQAITDALAKQIDIKPVGRVG